MQEGVPGGRARRLAKAEQRLARGRHYTEVCTAAAAAAAWQMVCPVRMRVLSALGPADDSPGGRAGGVAEAEQRLARGRHLRVGQAQLLLHGVQHAAAARVQQEVLEHLVDAGWRRWRPGPEPCHHLRAHRTLWSLRAADTAGVLLVKRTRQILACSAPTAPILAASSLSDIVTFSSHLGQHWASPGPAGALDCH